MGVGEGVVADGGLGGFEGLRNDASLMPAPNHTETPAPLDHDRRKHVRRLSRRELAQPAASFARRKGARSVPFRLTPAAAATAAACRDN